MTAILSVALENHPGALAELLQVIAEAKVNIHAIEAQAMGDFGGVRLQVADPTGTAEMLRKKRYDVVEADVLELSLPNKPGMLAKVAKQLADAEVNVVSLFGTTPVGSASPGRLLLRVNKPDVARRLLNLREKPAPQK
jgi:hypothetical protein